MNRQSNALGHAVITCTFPLAPLRLSEALVYVRFRYIADFARTVFDNSCSTARNHRYLGPSGANFKSSVEVASSKAIIEAKGK